MLFSNLVRRQSNVLEQLGKHVIFDHVSIALPVKRRRLKGPDTRSQRLGER